MAVIEYLDTHNDWATLEIRFEKNEKLGPRYNILRADNGRHLGWVCPPSEYGTGPKLWDSYVSSMAFLGDDKDDEGYVLDRVPYDLYNGYSTDSFKTHAVIHSKTRREATEVVLEWLVRHQAPAMGYSRHPRVVRYDRAKVAQLAAI